jgi:hypothetical protein
LAYFQALVQQPNTRGACTRPNLVLKWSTYFQPSTKLWAFFNLQPRPSIWHRRRFLCSYYWPTCKGQYSAVHEGNALSLRVFFKKGTKKKQNSKKGWQLEKFREMGASRPLGGRKGASRPTIGRDAQKKFPGTSSRIRKLFSFAKWSLKEASRPATGRDASRPATGRDASWCIVISCVCVFWLPKFVTIHRKIQK